MALEDRIRVVFEAVTDKATASVKSFRTAVGEAEGFTGKLKAGVNSLKDSFTNAAQSPLVMGAAVGAAAKIGLDAVHAFEGTAKAAIDLASATGLSTEQASRWIGVGDDFQITAEQLQVGIGKIGKTLDGAQWDKYGIATRDAAGHARDANAILLDAFAALSSVTNETQRAKEGNDLFGKGYAQLAPLIGHTRAEYEQMLGSVESGQVITDAEAKKAEAMRRAEDDLADAIKNLQLALGGLVADIAPVIEEMAHGITTAQSFAGAITHIADQIPGVSKLGGVGGIVKQSLLDMINPVNNVKTGFDRLTDSNNNFIKRALGVPGMIPVVGGAFNKLGDLFGGSKDPIDKAKQALEDHAAAAASDAQATEAAAYAAGMAKQYISDNAGALQAQSQQAIEAEASVAGYAEAWQRAHPPMEQAKTDAERAAAAQDMLAAATDRARQTADDATNKALDHIQAVKDSQRADAAARDAVIAYNAVMKNKKASMADVADAAMNAADQIENAAKADQRAAGFADNSKQSIDGQIKSLQAQADTLKPGSPLRVQLEQYIALLKSIPTSITTGLVIHESGTSVIGAKSNHGKGGVGFAGGTDNATPGVHPVGEHGMELVQFDGGERVISANDTQNLLGGAGGGVRIDNLTVNVTTNGQNLTRSDLAKLGRDIADSIHGAYKDGVRYPWMKP